MKKKDTKQRILDAALSLFNESGYASIRLHQIAKRAEMSVGNMAYHYRHKPEILLAVCAQLQEKHQLLLDEIQATPIFENLDYFLRSIYEFQHHYLFFYLDTLELIRTSEALKKQYRDYLELQEMQVEFLLQLNEARGAFFWPKEIDALSLSRQLIRTINSWHYMQIIEGHEVNFDGFRQAIWTVLKPFFTDQGWKEFHQTEEMLFK